MPTDTKDTELFELCQRVYEATGWDGTDKYWHSLISHDMKEWREYKLQDYKPNSLFGMRIVPLYTSDYLLEKLLPHTNIQFLLQSDGRTLLLYYPDVFEEEAIFADTPRIALLKLTLALYEAGELTNQRKALEEKT